MFQTFEAPASASGGGDRISRLRAVMAARGISAYLVPRADEHQGEYVAACAERLRWLTGFSGSAGYAAFTQKAAALFVDGRYTLQAPAQVDTGVLEVLQVPDSKLSDWLGKHLHSGDVVGYDPWLHTLAQIEALQLGLAAKQIKLKPVRANLVDAVWGRDRPPAPASRIVPHPDHLAGRAIADKIIAVRKRLEADGQEAVVLTLPDSIAWLLNIRGADVAHNPVVLAFAIIPRTGKPELYVAPEKVGDDARQHLGAAVALRAPAALVPRLTELRKSGAKVRVDDASAAVAIVSALGGAKRIARGKDPCVDMKAIKTEAEIAGARAAHLRDGVAMVRFLAWLDTATAKGGIDEITAVRQLETFRRETDALQEISFDTISGAGPNGAIVHYRVSQSTNRKLRSGELFLIDSGGQYLDGTTDITRTVAIGKPTREMRERFTLVLQGHIAIATARFPKGTRGIDLDPFARRALWDHGLDFDHGTGHGVGSYLSVHEGPQSISRRGMAELLPGMIISNEPGYYKAGAYGIRIENLVLVTPLEKRGNAERETMGFETLTLAPIDRRLIVPGMLSAAERSWIDAYHVRVAKALAPKLDRIDAVWLSAATAALTD